MRRLRSFWRCLDERADTASPLARWRLAARSDFDVLERFLVPAADSVSPVYPCPKCGRDLVVIPLGDAIVAEPDEGAPCRPVEGLAGDDVREYGLNWPGIIRAVGTATGCPLAVEETGGGCVCARADWVRDFRRVEVAARFGESDRAVSEEALRLIMAKGGGLLLTGRHRRACEGLLAGTSCGYAALEDVVGADEGGKLICACDLSARIGALPVCRETGPAATVDEWVFMDEGASYRIVMPEGEFTMPKQAGSMYLHWFVRHPRKDTRSLVVVAEVRGSGTRKVAGDWDDEDADASRAGESDDVDGMTTKDSMRRLYRELKAIKAERDRAEENGDLVRAAELDREVEGIEARMDKDTNRFGRIRKTANDDRKAEGTITRAVNRCYAGLRKAKGQQAARTVFVEHFKKHLSIAYMCRYDVPMEREWRTMGKK